MLLVVCVCGGRCFAGFLFNWTVATEIYMYLHTFSLHDALPILDVGCGGVGVVWHELVCKCAHLVADVLRVFCVCGGWRLIGAVGCFLVRVSDLGVTWL